MRLGNWVMLGGHGLCEMTSSWWFRKSRVHWRLRLSSRHAPVLVNESKKQRDQCGSSTQNTRVVYNGERGLALPLMPLFICES